jgi:hypothetical protein
VRLPVHQFLSISVHNCRALILVVERSPVKTVLRLLLLVFGGWLALTACAPNTGQLSSPKPTKPSDSISTEVKSADEGQLVGYEGGLYPPQNLALLASTGRPQFIHSYADW